MRLCTLKTERQDRTELVKAQTERKGIKNILLLIMSDDFKVSDYFFVLFCF